MFKFLLRCAAIFAFVSAAIAAPEAYAASVSYDDTAKVLAGITPATSVEAANEKSWTSHKRAMDEAWSKLDQRQLAKIRPWVASELPGSDKTLFYMFSGPDFLYASAYFPNATTYILAGLEPVGQAPDLTRLSASDRVDVYRELRASLGTLLNYSFFRTKDMKVDMRKGELVGTVPNLLAFLARANMTVNSLDYIDATATGELMPATAGKSNGVKIGFTAPSGGAKVLYYFSTDLSDGGIAKSGVIAFCKAQGQGAALVKSASYLMHQKEFSEVRRFLLANSTVLLQDDSGIPVQYFQTSDWTLKTYGAYLSPIGLFDGTYQKDLKKLYSASPKRKLPFGVGYRYKPSESNLMLGVRKDGAAPK
jgi:hypothetical protein